MEPQRVSASVNLYVVIRSLNLEERFKSKYIAKVSLLHAASSIDKDTFLYFGLMAYKDLEKQETLCGSIFL